MGVAPRYSVGHSFVSDSGATHEVVRYDNTRRSPCGRRDPTKYLCKCSRCHKGRWMDATRISKRDECACLYKNKQRLCEVCGTTDESLFHRTQANRCMACDRAWYRRRLDLSWEEFVTARRERFMRQAMGGAS